MTREVSDRDAWWAGLLRFNFWGRFGIVRGVSDGVNDGDDRR